MRRPADPTRPALAVLAGFSLALLVMIRPVGAPEGFRAVAGLAAVLVLPGFGLARRFGLLDTVEARLALCVPLSLALLGAVSAIGIVLRWPVLAVAALYLFVGFWVVAWDVLRAGSFRGRAAAPPFSRILGALILGSMILAIAARTPLSPYEDGFDHATTVNEIAIDGNLLPRQGLMADGELNRTDPRKGILHVGLAVVAVASGVPAHNVWSYAPVALCVSWLCLVFVLAGRFGSERRGALLAVALAILFAGGSPGGLTRLGYGSHLSMLVAWSAWWVVLAGLSKDRRPALWLLAVLGAVASIAHPLAPGFVAVPGVLFVLAAQRSGSVGPAIRSMGAFVLGSVPGLAFRVLETRGAINPIHTQVMPVFEFGGVSVLWPPDFLHQLGLAGMLALIATPFILRRFEDAWARRVVVATLATPLVFVLVPGVFDLAGRWTSSFPVKLLTMVPAVWILGMWWAPPWRGRALILRAITAGVLLASAPGMLRGFDPGRVTRSPEAERVLAALNRIEGRIVVAADPWLSSLIAAETPHYPITVFHQHGHPMDPRGLDRLNDLAAILSPQVSLAETAELMNRYRASHVAIAGPSALEVDFGAARGGRLTAERLEKFSSPVFRSRTDLECASLFELTGEAPASEALFDGSARPPLTPDSPGEPVAPGDGTVAGVWLDRMDFPKTVIAGSKNSFLFRWSRIGPAGWPVEAHIRLRKVGVPPVSKPGRWIAERLGGRSTRNDMRLVVTPFLGAWPTNRWSKAGVEDRVDVWVPTDIEPGDYTIAVRVTERPVHLRVGWTDIWGENDRWQGRSIGHLHVKSPESGG